jgi:hypothetical protein
MHISRTIKQLAYTVSPKLVWCLCGVIAAVPAWGSQTSVSTYHNDVRRIGWNNAETVLTPSAVGGTAFKQLVTVPLDDQSDTQPLYVPQQHIAGGVHDTIYVGTENNTIYAIDGESGKVLVQRNFGAGVPVSAVPGQCPNNIHTVGINSTPVIDAVSKTLYVITYNYDTGTPVYWIHALDLGTLNDKVPRVQIAATAKLTDGSTYNFDPATSRQRVALLLQNNTVYAAFTSFCDNVPSKTRGWVMGWKTGTLGALDKMLANKLAASPQTYFLSTIWMSGYGLAADDAHSVYFATGNSDPKNTQFYPNNLSESVIRMRSDLGVVQGYFTPGTATTGRAALDKTDLDFGAGGVMVIPAQPGKIQRMAVAAGKIGTMYLMNRASLGGYTNGADNVLQSVNIGQCFCGPSYYQGSDGLGRVVSSGGNQVRVWKITTSSTANPQLVQESESPPITSGQDAGFFTSISSNGNSAGSQVIWALSRPSTAHPAAIELYAFDPNAGGGQAKTIFAGDAGQWPNADGNANLVPTVANGHVYVASYKELTIFGLSKAGATAQPATAPQTATTDEMRAALPGHAVYGKLKRADKTTLTLETRTGSLLTVDATPALKAETSVLPVVGRAYLARGEYDRQGVLHAMSVARVKDQPELWKPDR